MKSKDQTLLEEAYKQVMTRKQKAQFYTMLNKIALDEETDTDTVEKVINATVNFCNSMLRDPSRFTHNDINVLSDETEVPCDKLEQILAAWKKHATANVSN